jgi:uncharacterized protein YfdQ (DUF2303 family)
MLKEIITSLRGLLASTVAAPVEVKVAEDVGYLKPVYVTAHESTRIHDLTEAFRETIEGHFPFRRKGASLLTDPHSVVDFVHRFGDGDSVIFVDEGDFGRGGSKAPSMTAIINYHRSGSETLSATGQGEGNMLGGRDITARPGDHTATYNFPLTEAFRAWMNAARSGFSQAAMGEFVDDRVDDFEEPTPALRAADKELVQQGWEEPLVNLARRLGGRFGGQADLRALATSFEVNEYQNLKITRNPTTGEASFEFLNEHRQRNGEPVSIPTLFLANVQVFNGGPFYRVPVRLTYRKDGSKVTFFLKIANLNAVFEKSIKQLVSETVAKTAADGGIWGEDGIPVFWGVAR